MRRKQALRQLACLLAAFFALALWGLPARAAEEELYEKSGVGGLYEALDQETQELLDQAGAGEGVLGDGLSGRNLFEIFSGLVQEKLTAPLKALAALVAVCVLCRIACCFEEGELAGTARLVGCAACGMILAGPAVGLLAACQRVTESAGLFLGAAAPVYAGLLAATGSIATGSGYSFLAMLAGEGIPVLAAGFLLPLLRVYLGVSVASAVSGAKLSKLTTSLYNFVKWALVTAVTVFAGVLSVQTALNSQVDAATAKAVKLALSSGVPIVGGALGDAVSALQNSVQMVKSGAGAFGVLAAICIFLPSMLECLLWTAVCMAGQVAADLLEASEVSALLGAFAGAVRMVLAVLASVCAVCAASAGAIVFAGS